MTRALIPSAVELVGRGQAGVQGDARPDQGHLVTVAGAEHLGATDRERLARVVEHRVGTAGRAHVDDAVAIGHGLDERRRAGGVARVQDRGALHRAHHGQVLQGHLGRAVGTNLNARVRSDQADARLRDGGHPDEVISAGEEGREGGGERPVAAHADADGGRDQLLLGDVHLEVPFGILLRELVGKGGVADLAVHRDDVAAGADRGQRVAVGLAGRDLVPDGVARQRYLGGAAVAPAGGATGPGFGPRTIRLRSPPSSMIARSAI